MNRIAGGIAAGVAALGVAAASLLLAVPAQAAAGSADTGSVTLIHGIPGFVANVFVDHKPVASDFKAYTSSGPYALPAGQHTIDIYPSTNKAGTGQPTLESTMTLKAGQNVSWVAHTDLNNRPTFTSWVNDLSAIPSGETRFVMRHVAVTGAVDILADGSKAVSDVSYGQQSSVDVPSGTIQATVVRAGTTQVLAGPLSATFAPGTEFIAYGVGSQRAGTLSVVTQQISGLPTGASNGAAAVAGGVPTGVPAGTGGFAAAATGVPVWVWSASAAAMLVALSAGAFGLRAARARR